MSIYQRVRRVAGVFVALALTGFMFYTALLAFVNLNGASTLYTNPTIGTGERHEGKTYVYVGDEFYVWIQIVRLAGSVRVNSTCRFRIERYAEYVGGRKNGQRLLISQAELQFRGDNLVMRTRWPIQSEPYFVGWGADENGIPRFMLDDDQNEQEFTFYVVGRYFCNYLDHIFPRYIQGGDRPNITPRVNAIVIRKHK